MSEVSHTAAPLSVPQPYIQSPGAVSVCLSLVVMGVTAFTIGLFVDPQRAWANYLLNYFFWLCLGLSGLFFTALQHITGATWSVPVRRVAESFSAFVPVAALLFFVLLFGLTTLYPEWTNLQHVAADPLLSGKRCYLNVNFFAVRSLVFYAFVILVGSAMVRNSLKQDRTGDASLTLRNVRLSAPFLIIFSWLFTFMSFDLIMSLTPHWFSTIFGVYCWSGLFYSGLAMLMLWVMHLRARGNLDGFVTDEHLHGIGKFMFAFVVFWAYIAFSQYMLIWYANLPEEIGYMIVRTQGPWAPIGQLLTMGKFALPLFFLITQPAKRKPGFMKFTALWMLGAQWVDLYWMIFPTFYKAPVFGWMEVAMFAGFAGAFVWSVGRFLSRHPVVAYRDPFIAEGVGHHQ